MKIFSIIFLLFLCFPAVTRSQSALGHSGVVEYEKKVNIHGILKKTIGGSQDVNQQVYDDYVNKNPQFAILNSRLTFSTDECLFEPLTSPNLNNSTLFGKIPLSEQINITYSDLKQGLTWTRKNAFNEQFLIENTRKIRWKVTNELRDVAGFKCRRANAIIMDSIYVVAFYTDEIHVSSGPETFGGLPGLILEVALPNDNIHWVAKRVNFNSSSHPIVKTTQGKPMTDTDFTKLVITRFQSDNNRKRARLNIINYLL